MKDFKEMFGWLEVGVLVDWLVCHLDWWVYRLASLLTTGQLD